jgi:hypothetical protein
MIAKAWIGIGLALIALEAVGSTAKAGPPGYRDCSSRYWAGGVSEVAVRNMTCSSAAHVLRGGFTSQHNLRRGGFRCTRERNAENVLWVNFCHSGSKRLFFDTE